MKLQKSMDQHTSPQTDKSSKRRLGQAIEVRPANLFLPPDTRGFWRPRTDGVCCLGQHLVDDVAVNVGEAEVAALEAVIQLGVVEAQ